VTHNGNAAQDEQSAVADVAARALRACEQQFGRIPTSWVMISLATGRSNLYLAVNDAYCELTGYARGELNGGDFLGDIHPEDQPALETLIQGVMSGVTSLIRTEVRLVRKDGEIVHGDLNGSAIQPPTGHRYLAAFIEDISAAQQAQTEICRLRRELQQSRRLASLGHDGRRGDRELGPVGARPLGRGADRRFGRPRQATDQAHAGLRAA
jgi:PAS domain S-box-containing protein